MANDWHTTGKAANIALGIVALDTVKTAVDALRMNAEDGDGGTHWAGI